MNNINLTSIRVLTTTENKPLRGVSGELTHEDAISKRLRDLLKHGDSLCTDDVDHQKFREIVPNSNWCSEFLALPLSERQQRAIDMRTISSKSKENKCMEFLDVNQSAVIKTMKDITSVPFKYRINSIA